MNEENRKSWLVLLNSTALNLYPQKPVDREPDPSDDRDEVCRASEERVCKGGLFWIIAIIALYR